MKVRHLAAVLGIAIAVSAVTLMQSMVSTNDAQSERVAERLLRTVSVDAKAEVARGALDYRPEGHVMQGPPMAVTLATSDDPIPVGTCRITRALFAQRNFKTPSIGDELTIVGEKGVYRLKISEIVDWHKPARGYPNLFVSRETRQQIGERWNAWTQPTIAQLSPLFRSDAEHNFDRAKALLLWAAALTALCLLVNTLFLSVEAKRRELALLRMVGMTGRGVMLRVIAEATVLVSVGVACGIGLTVFGWWNMVASNGERYPMGVAFPFLGFALVVAIAYVVGFVGALIAIKPALAVKPLEAASVRMPKRGHCGMLLSVAFGFGAFVAVEVWGASLMSAFIPSTTWPDAIVSILPGGVSSFEIEKLQSLEGVRRIAEVQPLQVNLDPLEELPVRGGPTRGNRKAYHNALLLASDWFPFCEVPADDTCVITEMMARAKNLRVGDELSLDCGGDFKVSLKIARIIDLNWHLVTSRGLMRGLNRMTVETDGPVFVNFDTLAICDSRPQEFVHMTHLWLDFNDEFETSHGVFAAGRKVERAIVEALNGATLTTKEGEVRGNTVRLHARDEISDGTLAHGAQLVGDMARVPFLFIAVLSLGFIALLVASVDARKREFRVLRAVGATKLQLAGLLAVEAIAVAAKGLLLGLPGGALIGWLATSGTRAAMASWGIPPSFVLPIGPIVLGAIGAIAFALVVIVPTAGWVIYANRGAQRVLSNRELVRLG